MTSDTTNVIYNAYRDARLLIIIIDSDWLKRESRKRQQSFIENVIMFLHVKDQKGFFIHSLSCGIF